jgi:hypothetical protein
MHPLKCKTTIYDEKRGIRILKNQKMSRCKKNKTSNLIRPTLCDMKEKTVRETIQKRIAFCIKHGVHICSGKGNRQLTLLGYLLST